MAVMKPVITAASFLFLYLLHFGWQLEHMYIRSTSIIIQLITMSYEFRVVFAIVHHTLEGARCKNNALLRMPHYKIEWKRSDGFEVSRIRCRFQKNVIVGDRVYTLINYLEYPSRFQRHK